MKTFSISKCNLIVLLLIQLLVAQVFSADCNNNGVEDAEDLANGTLTDCDANGEIDQCETTILSSLVPQGVKGHGQTEMALTDVNNDGFIDVVWLTGSVIGVIFSDEEGRLEAGPRFVEIHQMKDFCAMDFNGDGNVDIVTTNNSLFGAEIHLLVGAGDGTFELTSSQDGFLNLKDLSSQDLDQDGGEDLYFVDPFENKLYILFNNLEGGFEEPLVLSTPRGPHDVAASDFNLDGRIDLVLGSVTNGSQLTVYLSDGDRSFTESSQLSLDKQPLDVELGDIDSDGHLDLIVLLGDQIGLFMGQANGSFNPGLQIDLPFNGSDLTVGDFDGNQVLDVAAVRVNRDGLAVLLFDEGGVPRPLLELISTAEDYIASSDFNSDGLDDLVIQGSGLISLKLSSLQPKEFTDCDSDGTPDSCQITENLELDQDSDGILDTCQTIPFPEPDCNRDGQSDGQEILEGEQDCDLNHVPDSCQHSPNSIPFKTGLYLDTGTEPINSTGADFDKDGQIELAVLNDRAGLVTYFDQDEDGKFFHLATFESDRDARKLFSGDFNSDSWVDLAVLNYREQQIDVYLNNAEGQFLPRLSTVIENRPLDYLWIDLNKDGQKELIVSVDDAFEDPQLKVYNFNEDGTLIFVKPIEIPDLGSDLEHGDFNEDGWWDLLIRSSSKYILLFGKENIEFSEPTLFTPAGTDLIVGDFDEDGHQDILSFSFDAHLMRGLGNGQFVEGGLTPLYSPLANPITLDINQDGHLDLIGGSNRSDSVSILHGDGKGRFYPSISLATASKSAAVIALDLDQNSHEDLVICNRLSKSLHIIYSEDNGEFDSIYRVGRLPTPQDSSTLALLETTETGEVNLAVGAGMIGIFICTWTPSNRFIQKYRIELEFGASSIQSQDLNQDGRKDLIVKAVNRNLHYVLLANDDGSFSQSQELYNFDLNHLRYEAYFSDVNQDGSIDIVQNYVSHLLVFLNDGEGGFNQGQVNNFKTSIIGCLVEDVTGDGLLDLVTCNDDGEVLVLPGFSVGTFSDESDLIRSPVGDHLALVGLQSLDFNHDGIMDVATLHTSMEGELIRLEGLGDGRFQLNSTYSVGFFPRRLIVEHLDGDLDADYLVFDGNFENLTVLSGAQNEMIKGATQIRIGDGVKDVVFLDRDGDETLEILSTTNNDSHDFIEIFYLPNHSTIFTPDCDGNEILDRCEIQNDPNLDLDKDGSLDSCQDDCNQNGLVDTLDISEGTEQDCNENEVPDSCEIRDGFSLDRNSNGIPDECEPDCNENNIPDEFEITNNLVSDCDEDGIPDVCEIDDGSESDIDSNGILDSCQEDCDEDGRPDSYEIEIGQETDCDQNGILDSCEIASGGLEVDKDGDGVLDRCEPDCDEDEVPDDFAIENGLVADCDDNGIPDSCDIREGTLEDCDENQIPDTCQIARNGELDQNENQVLDTCEGGFQVPGDCNGDAIIDLSDAICLMGHLFLGIPDKLPCQEFSGQESQGTQLLLDWQGDSLVDLTDAISVLSHTFLGTQAHHLAPDPLNSNVCIPIAGCHNNEKCE